MATIVLARLIDHEETWEWMVLGALGWMNYADFEKSKLQRCARSVYNNK